MRAPVLAEVALGLSGAPRRVVRLRITGVGLRPLTADGVPMAGEVRPGLFVATGHAMLGITLAPSTAEALAPAVLGEEPPEALDGLSPLRFARNGAARERVGAGA